MDALQIQHCLQVLLKQQGARMQKVLNQQLKQQTHSTKTVESEREKNEIRDEKYKEMVSCNGQEANKDVQC